MEAVKVAELRNRLDELPDYYDVELAVAYQHDDDYTVQVEGAELGQGVVLLVVDERTLHAASAMVVAAQQAEEAMPE